MYEEKAEAIMLQARKLHGERVGYDQFYREIFSSNGLVRRLTPDERKQFEASPNYEELLSMLNSLRIDPNAHTYEPVSVITVRLPVCIHKTLMVEAHENLTSLNQHCIAKLLQPLKFPDVSAMMLLLTFFCVGCQPSQRVVVTMDNGSKQGDLTHHA